MSKPNLPTEDELKQQIDKLIPCVQCDGSGAYAVDNGYGEPEPEQCQYCYQYRFPAIEKLAELIHHYATKREVEARIDEVELHLWDSEGKAYPGINCSETNEVLEARLEQLKAQKEQENK